MSQNTGIIAPDDWMQGKIDEQDGIFDRKSYESSVKYVKNGHTAIDIGAHCGSWSNALAKEFKHVHAFEPDVRNHEFLKQNVEKHKNITLYDVALGNKKGRCTIKHGEHNSGQAHISKGSDVYIMTLDSFKFTNVDFIKIDVEGYEWFVLKGAEKAIEENKPVICLELNGLGMRYDIDDSKIFKLMYNKAYILSNVENKDYIFCPK